MKIATKYLKDILQKLSVNQSSKIPMHHNVLMIAKKKMLNLISNDGNNVVISKGTVSGEIETLIPYHILKFLVGISDTLKFEKDKETLIVTTDNNQTYMFCVSDVDEFRAILPSIEVSGQKMKISEDKMQSIMNLAKFCGNDENTLGVYFAEDEIVSTDRFKLGIAHTKNEIKNVIIPNSFLKIISKLKSGTLELEGENIKFAGGNGVVVSNIVNLSFLEYKKAIPNHTDTVSVSKEELSKALSNASIALDKYSRVKLTVKENELIISSENDEINYERTLSASSTKWNIEIAVSSIHLQTILDILNDKDVINIGFDTPNSPLTINNSQYTNVLMPIQAVEEAEEAEESEETEKDTNDNPEESTGNKEVKETNNEDKKTESNKKTDSNKKKASNKKKDKEQISMDSSSKEKTTSEQETTEQETTKPAKQVA